MRHIQVRLLIGQQKRRKPACWGKSGQAPGFSALCRRAFLLLTRGRESRYNHVTSTVTVYAAGGPDGRKELLMFRYRIKGKIHMPIRVQNDLPVKEILEQENIFVMDEYRAAHQDIRPISIGLLNLMPLKEDTELQILRSLSNTPLQVDVTFVRMTSHVSKNTSTSHIYKFYEPFEGIKDKKFDGFIITGAPVEQLPFEEVDYWEELKEIMEWTRTTVTSTLHLCWGAQAGLYYHYGIGKTDLPRKLSGVYRHRVRNRKIPLVRGFDDVFMAPHSRHTEVPQDLLEADERITILADSRQAGVFLCMAEEGRQIFVMGHPEYDRMTLDSEYKRDMGRGLNPQIPENYYPDDDPDNKPVLTWRAHANNLYTNWLNYYVYQVTPYDLYGTPF